MVEVISPAVIASNYPACGQECTSLGNSHSTEKNPKQTSQMPCTKLLILFLESL